VGEIAAESIIPYPPGIPLILAGERITILMLENLLKLRNSGARFQGGSIIEKNMLKVFRP
jgi:arginine/lysine/ornithine decarboxylase